MPRKWTKTEAFRQYGALCANARWSWSGRDANNSVVALTFWTDRFVDFSSRPIVYRDQGWGGDADRVNRPGNRERIENIQFAIDLLDGIVHVVMARAVDIDARPRKVELFWPNPKLIMRITEFDPKTGEWAAQSVSDPIN